MASRSPHRSPPLPKESFMKQAAIDSAVKRAQQRDATKTNSTSTANSGRQAPPPPPSSSPSQTKSHLDRATRQPKDISRGEPSSDKNSQRCTGGGGESRQIRGRERTDTGRVSGARQERTRKLEDVFALFDLDQSGFVDQDELLMLGKVS